MSYQSNESFERDTQERINRQKTDLELRFAMIDASAQLQLDELLVDKSEEYRAGFLAGREFEAEVTNEIINGGKNEEDEY